MNKTMKRNVLVSALLAIALCLSVMVGATFALFTSESKVNVAVSSGKVSVVATASDLELGTTLGSNDPYTQATLNGNVITLSNIVPGDYVTFNINVHNESTVSVKYRTVIQCEADDGLFEGLVVTFNDAAFNGESSVSDWMSLAPNAADQQVSVKIALPESAGNAFQNKSCSISYTVEAVQGNAPANTEENVYIYTAYDFEQLMNKTQNVNSAYLGKTIYLMNDIDFGGKTVKGVGSENCNFAGTFDGQGHTVSNFVIENDREFYSALFNQVSCGGAVKNLTVKNATVVGNKMVAAVASNADDATVENCHAENCTVIANMKKAAAVVAYVPANGTVNNCSSKNCAIYCLDTDSAESGKVVGYVAEGAAVTSCDTAENVTVTTGVTGIAISTAEELFAFANDVNQNRNTYSGKTVVLANDIDLKNQLWTPIGQTTPWIAFAGTFDGKGHTISNLFIDEDQLTLTSNNDGIGFFGWLHGKVQNVNFKNAELKGHRRMGVVAGVLEFGTLDNCTVENASIENSHKDDDRCGDKSGSIVGFVQPNNGNMVKNCSAKNCTVKGGRDAGQLIGMAYSAQIENFSGNTATSVTVSSISGCTGENVQEQIIGRIG